MLHVKQMIMKIEEHHMSIKRKKKNERKTKWTQKQLNGQFIRQTRIKQVKIGRDGYGKHA